MNLKFISKIIPAIAFMIVGCAHQKTVQPVNWTTQQIQNSVLLQPKMTEQEVIQILGNPITKEFEGMGSALQWCKTGMGGTRFPYDRFLIGFFYNGKLVGTRNYTNKNNNTFGDCATLYREIEWTPSDTVIEYRFKN